MGTPEHVRRWLDARLNDPFELGNQRIVNRLRADALELLDLCRNEELASAIRQERFRLTVRLLLSEDTYLRRPKAYGDLGLLSSFFGQSKRELREIQDLAMEDSAEHRLVRGMVRARDAVLAIPYSSGSENLEARARMWLQEFEDEDSIEPDTAFGWYLVGTWATLADSADRAIAAFQEIIAITDPSSPLHLSGIRLEAGVLARSGEQGAGIERLLRGFAEIGSANPSAIDLLTAVFTDYYRPLEPFVDSALTLLIKEIFRHDRKPASPEIERRIRHAGLGPAWRLKRWADLEALLIEWKRFSGERDSDYELMLKAELAIARANPRSALIYLNRALQQYLYRDNRKPDWSRQLRLRMQIVEKFDSVEFQDVLLKLPHPRLGVAPRSEITAAVARSLAEAHVGAGPGFLANAARLEDVQADAEATYFVASALGHLAYASPAGVEWTSTAERIIDDLDGSGVAAGMRCRLLVARGAHRRRLADADGALADARTAVSLALTDSQRDSALRQLVVTVDWLDEEGRAELARSVAVEAESGLASFLADRPRYTTAGVLRGHHAKMLLRLDRADDAVTAAQGAVDQALAGKQDSSVDGVVSTFVDILDACGLREGDRWLALIEELAGRLAPTRHRDAIIQVHFWWAYALNDAGRQDEAIELVEALLSSPQTLQASPHRRVDAMVVGASAAGWTSRAESGVCDRIAKLVVAIADGLETLSPSLWSKARTAELSALAAAEQREEALDRISRYALVVDELSDENGRSALAKMWVRVLADGPQLSKSIANVMSWHQEGRAGHDLVGVLLDASERLFRAGNRKRALETLRSAVGDAESQERTLRRALHIVDENIKLPGEHLLPVAEWALALATNPSGRHDALSMQGMLLASLGRVDESVATLEEAAREAFRIEDPPRRLNAFATTGVRLLFSSYRGPYFELLARELLVAFRAGKITNENTLTTAQGLWADLDWVIDADTDALDPVSVARALESAHRSDDEARLINLMNKIVLEPALRSDPLILDSLQLLRKRPLDANSTHAQINTVMVAESRWASGRCEQARNWGDLTDDESDEISEAFRRSYDLCRQMPHVGLTLAPYQLLHFASHVDELSDPARCKAQAEFVLKNAVSASLQLDARASASRDLDTRRHLLLAASTSWMAAYAASSVLEDQQTTIDIIAVRRASLVLTVADTSNVVAPSHVPELVLESPGTPDEELARAASSSLIVALDSSGIAVVPRPLIRMPDGRIALERFISGLSDENRNAWISPFEVSLA